MKKKKQKTKIIIVITSNDTNSFIASLV